MLLMIAAAAASHVSADIAAIRLQRARSNGAIAAHRFEDMAPLLMADYTLLPGSLGTPLQGEAAARRLAAGFAGPGFVTYVRTPKTIRIAANGRRASETGAWIGTWRKADGEMRLTGIYQAMWVPFEGGWRLQNESFVSLRCTGSRECAEVY
jgi:ketosteroid isomerase-like protein